MKANPCLLRAALALALCSGLVAQTATHVIPNIGTGTATSNTSYPWNRTSSPVRVQYIYDPSELPGYPIKITRLRFRPNDAAATTVTWTGGTYGDVTILMSHARVAYNALTTTFANNHSATPTTVFQNGSVVLQAGAGTGAGIPSNYYADVRVRSRTI